jgi:hypothetical protein
MTNMTNMNKNINYDCLHCNAYFTNRMDIKKMCKFVPINENCTNPYCKTIKEIEKKIVEKNIKGIDDTMDSDDDTFTNEENFNWDNWDLEPNVKSLKRKRENSINDLHDLFKNIYIKENKSSAGKKKKKLKQQKITSYDINYLLNKLDLKV